MTTCPKCGQVTEVHDIGNGVLSGGFHNCKVYKKKCTHKEIQARYCLSCHEILSQEDEIAELEAACKLLEEKFLNANNAVHKLRRERCCICRPGDELAAEEDCIDCEDKSALRHQIESMQIQRDYEPKQFRDELEARIKEKDEEIKQYYKVTYGESKYNDVGLYKDQNYLAFVLGNFVNLLENNNYKIAMLRKAIEPFAERANKHIGIIGNRCAECADRSPCLWEIAKRAYEQTA